MIHGANLFLVAAPRSGSTQLAQWLSTHPEIDLPMLKEPNFFANDDFPEDYVKLKHLNDVDPRDLLKALPKQRAQFAIIRNTIQYEALYAPLKAKWRCDASTTYLSCPRAPQRIHSAIPNARIIILTRDPIDRAVSHYRLAIRTGRTRRSLRQEIVRELEERDPPGARYILRPSLYSNGLSDFVEIFSANQRLHIEFENLVSDPENLMLSIANFLNIPFGGFDLSKDAKNSAAQPRFPWLNESLLKTGIKTSIRRSIPPSMKPTMKKFWFSHKTLPEIHASDIAFLEECLASS